MIIIEIQEQKTYKSVCMLLSCHVQILAWIYALKLPECQETPCSKQASYLKFLRVCNDIQTHSHLKTEKYVIKQKLKFEGYKNSVE